VGRSALTLPVGAAQPLVANGIAFDREGDMLVADTARGALWRVRFDHHGGLKSRLGCDTTLAANALCAENVWVAHPLLEGVDGIALDRAGNVYAAANERNAIVRVTRKGRVAELFRNAPDATTGLRNAGPLEFPTSPFLLGDLLCVTSSDNNRRDNSPSTAGEIGGAGQPKGKLSCLDQRLAVPGLPLPVHSAGH
jgi:sugar lactone lactonase YvrE